MKQYILHQDKMPVSPYTLKPFEGGKDWQRDPSQWVDYNTAKALAAATGLELGFLFTLDDPYFLLDIDHCRHADGTWSDLAMSLCNQFPGAYREVSRSGTGLHIIGRYDGLAPEHRCKNGALGIELYTAFRFVALTEDHASGSWDAVCDLGPLVAQYFAPVSRNAVDWSDRAAINYNGPLDDDDLIAKASRTRSVEAAFGGKATFKELWNANPDALALAFPPNKPGAAYDASSADAALAMHLAFWTGKNARRVHDLMQRSALARDKWQRNSYLETTILGAMSLCRDYPGRDTAPVLRPVDPTPPSPVASPDAGAPPEPEVVVGAQFLGATLQVQHFAGCVYVAEDDLIYTKAGESYKRTVFDAMFGGYTFQMDEANRKTTKSAWEAFTQSQVVRHPKVPGTQYRPDLPPRTVVNGLLNVYAGGTGARVDGDVTPFLRHCEKLLPVEADRAILLSWMAAIVQHPGIKFNWAPFIQGVEGNGKSLFIRVMEYCVGERNTFLPRADEIVEKYNKWLFCNQFIGINDLYMPSNKLSVWEVVKPMITEERQPKREMRSEWEVGRVCANFMINSNHQDAVPRSANDRRAAPLFTAQQVKEHLNRDGMTGDYFPTLYRWLRNGGYAAVAHYLASYAIPDALNPAKGCQRAPTTSSDAQSIQACLGGLEMAVAEAIAEGRPGFRGGYVSSWALTKLFEERRLRYNPARRGEIMANVGYLPVGRMTIPSPLDGHVKPYIYSDQGRPIAGYLAAQQALD